MTRTAKERWVSLSPLLDELLDADDRVRAARLGEIRQLDPRLANELAGVLENLSVLDRSGFLAGSAMGITEEAGLAGKVVGNYTLEQPLGRGGMGSVWLARRSDGRYEGQVAIKFLRAVVCDPKASEQFRREGTALSRLSHPNIASLVDAGVTATGQLYLVLEHIKGAPLDAWCSSAGLDVRARVHLFMQVVAAVGYAHSQLILHRDLKPANILVTANGQVKLLDFGIAKLLNDARASVTAPPTPFARRAFTPEYAAPEQVEGAAVTTATDVYALGVLLYQLLTRLHPTHDAAATPVVNLRAIATRDPVPPSVAVARASAPEADDGVHKRAARQLQGDLDSIVATALAKHPSQRYQTADALADDLQRYLDGRPVTAHAATLRYRTRKYLSRNRYVAGAVAAALIAVSTAATVALMQAREVSFQRDRARLLSARNTAIVDFVNSMFTEVVLTDQPIELRELMERSRAMFLTDGVEPEHRAAVESLLANYFVSRGDLEQAEALLAHALALMRSNADADLRARLSCEHAYAATLLDRPEASSYVKAAIASRVEDPALLEDCRKALRDFVQPRQQTPGGASTAAPGP